MEGLKKHNNLIADDIPSESIYSLDGLNQDLAEDGGMLKIKIMPKISNLANESETLCAALTDATKTTAVASGYEAMATAANEDLECQVSEMEISKESSTVLSIVDDIIAANPVRDSLRDISYPLHKSQNRKVSILQREAEVPISEDQVSRTAFPNGSTDVVASLAKDDTSRDEIAETVSVDVVTSKELSKGSASSHHKRKLRANSSISKVSSGKIPKTTEQNEDLSQFHPVFLYSNEETQNKGPVLLKLSKKLKRISKVIKSGVSSAELDQSQLIDAGDNSTSILGHASFLNCENKEIMEKIQSSVNLYPSEYNLTPKPKKVRNPYGRKGKPANLFSTASTSQSVKAKKSRVFACQEFEPDISKPDVMKLAEFIKPELMKPEWQKPFEQGWRREIVYRNTGLVSETHSGRKCDIYYFTPENSKLRSTPQIMTYLSQHETDLTPECFTFIKQLVHHEPAEFVRSAGSCYRRLSLPACTKLPKKHKKKKLLQENSIKPHVTLNIKLKLKKKDFLQMTDSSKFEIEECRNQVDDSSATVETEMDFCGRQTDLSDGRPLFQSTLVNTHLSQSKEFADSSLLSVSNESNWKSRKPKKRRNLAGIDKVSRKSSKLSTNNLSEKVIESGSTKPNDTDASSSFTKLGASTPNVNTEETTENETPSSFGQSLFQVENVYTPATLEIPVEKVLPRGHKSKWSKVSKPDESENRVIKTLAKNLINSCVAKKSKCRNTKFLSKTDTIKIRMSYKERLPEIQAKQKENTKAETSWTAASEAKQKEDAGHEASQTALSLNGGNKEKKLMKLQSGSLLRPIKARAERTWEGTFCDPVTELRPCGLHCAGKFGLAPSLQCDMCMCMFHPECVGINHVPHRTSFTCKACCAINAEFIRFTASDDAFAGSYNHMEDNVTSSSNGLISTPTVHFSSSPSTPVRFSTNHSMLSSVHASEAVTDRAAEPVSVSLADMDPRKLNGRILTLPHGIASLLDLSQPMTLSLGGHKHKVSSNCFMLTPNGLRVLLPNNIFSAQPPVTSTSPLVLSSSQHFLADPSQNTSRLQRMNHSSLNLRSNGYSQTVFGTSLTNNINVQHQVVNENIVENEAILSNSSDKTITADCSTTCARSLHDEKLIGYFENVFTNGGMILCIFKFLHIVDLMKAAVVCTAWKKISENSLLWNHVNLNGIRVLDWNVAAHHFKKNNTHSLNLTRLVHNGSENQTWHQMTAIFSSLVTIRQLVFGPCPAHLLYFVASKMTELQSLKALYITDVIGENQVTRLLNAKLDIGKIAALRNLVRLDLRGTHGLVLPAFSFTSGLAELGQLCELKHLSITTLREVPGKEFLFLSYLKKLETLEIGDCELWTPETYKQLGQLVHLRKLKLEHGVESQEMNLSASLKKLTKLEHLELLWFIISKSFAEFLPNVSHLRILCYCSNDKEESIKSNSCMLTAVLKMTFLKEFTWYALRTDAYSYFNSTMETPQSSMNNLIPLLTTALLNNEVDMNLNSDTRAAVEWQSMKKLELLLKEFLLFTNVQVLDIQDRVSGLEAHGGSG